MLTVRSSLAISKPYFQEALVASKLIGIQVALSRRRGTWQMAEGTRIKSFSFFAKVCNLNVSRPKTLAIALANRQVVQTCV